METSPVTCHTLEDFYHIDGHTFEKQYKEVLSGFREWEQLEHADKWLLFPKNIGARVAIDESALSNGELYTFVTNRDARTREQSLIAVVAGTKAENVISVLEKIDEETRKQVKEVTLDLSDSMRKIVKSSFPQADRVIDRFHIQKLACDAVQELRIKHRWDAIQQANDEMEEAKLSNKRYIPFYYPNGDTRKELLIRSRYLLFKSANNWTDRQKERASILFKEYPDIKTAYSLCHSLRMIFSKNTIKDAARLSMAKWYNKVEEAGMRSFNVIAATFYEHYEEILNFYTNRSSNAMAESFNAKIKLFRANLRGVADKKFFLFRIQIYTAIPTKNLLSPFEPFVTSFLHLWE
jgi:transposase